MVNERQEMLDESATLYFGPWYRRSPFFEATRRAGCTVVGEGETASWTSHWPLPMEFRNARTGLLLQPDQADGDTILRTPLPRTRRADFPPGRGFWVKGGVATKLQVPLVEV